MASYARSVECKLQRGRSGTVRTSLRSCDPRERSCGRPSWPQPAFNRPKSGLSMPRSRGNSKESSCSRCDSQASAGRAATSPPHSNVLLGSVLCRQPARATRRQHLGQDSPCPCRRPLGNGPFGNLYIGTAAVAGAPVTTGAAQTSSAAMRVPVAVHRAYRQTDILPAPPVPRRVPDEGGPDGNTIYATAFSAARKRQRGRGGRRLKRCALCRPG